MSIKDRIQSLVNKKEEIDGWALTNYILCKTFGWDYHILCKQPIPFVFAMMDCIKYEADKAEEKNNNKQGNEIKGGMAKKCRH